MQTITRRRQPHHSGNESAAIALTARLLSGLKTDAADAEYLMPAGGGNWWFSPDSNFTIQTSGGVHSYFDRDFDRAGPAWRGNDERLDMKGRTWERRFRAVQDDFGNLVEIAS